MKILAIQNRMGIGDTVIFLPFIKAISNRFNSPVSLLVKENSKANEFLNHTKYVDQIIYLERDNKKNERHDGIVGFFRLINDLKKYKFEKVYIFNSSLRFNLIARLAGIKEINQYPLFKKQNQHITEPAKNLIKDKLDIEINDNPEIQLDNNLIQQSIEEEQKILSEIYNSKFKNKCYQLDNLTISETLPIIKNCNISICNDTGFAHLSAALGVKTITLMADTPLIYGSYNSNMYPVIPDGETTVRHDTLGKDKINPEKIYDKFVSIIN